MNKQEIYNKIHPFPAKIKERYLLCKPGSKKCTFHLVLDLEGSGLTYRVGDSLGVYPLNNKALVERTLLAVKAKGDELVTDRNGNQIAFREFLTSKANITSFSRKFFSVIAEKQSNPQKRAALKTLLTDEYKDEFKEYTSHHEVWDFLEKNQEVILSPQEMAQLLMPLLPRLYSIASSQLAVGNEVHLTIALTRYQTLGVERQGVCTHYLCYDCPLGQPVVPIYIQPHHGFTLPESSDASLIMIGPGTGVAPFRAFMQERLHKKHAGLNWLFFGEWTRNHDYFYEDEWTRLEKEGLIKLQLAFSRDQEHKVYVQHRLMENAAEIFQWLEKGAYIFVCGDAKHMAKDVEQTLLTIIMQHGSLSEEGAKAYLKKLRSEKRYLRDIY
ncbi:MAG: diflavin oxidoreductase [Parachlamydiaceae bacterium]